MKEGLKWYGEKPVFGHGVGSVFFEMGTYSHNFITDAMVEVGVIGTFILFSLFIILVFKAIKDIYHDISDSLWLIIFLDGLVMSLFSGYYLAQIPLWWSVAFYFSNIDYRILYNK